MGQARMDAAAVANGLSSAKRSHSLLDMVGSVWLGIVLLVLLFIYCSIGSAVPAVRQHAALEMTEFEWFHWWPFKTLVVLFCVCMTLVTVRRIPLRLVNAGVWMIHTGIITLCLGSFYYFGTKVEGDAPVFRRQVRIELPGLDRPETLVVLPGSRTHLIVDGEPWHFEIESTNTEWPILSGDDEGQKAYCVFVRVSPPEGEPFLRQLLAGYPQYTEDIIPGKGRAIKSTGKKLLIEDLRLALALEPQPYFHVMDTRALYVRRVGDAEWTQRPIRDLPRYHDRVGTRELVFSDPHEPIVPRTLDLEVPPAGSEDALSGASVRITGFLRYAHMDRRWVDGGAALNPVLQASLVAAQAPPESFELVAFDPARRQARDGVVEFLWLENEAEIDRLPVDARALVHIEVPEANVALDVPLSEETVAGRGGAFTDVEGTEFAYRIVAVQDGLALTADRPPVSVAMVDIKTPEGQFRRWVMDDPELTRDIHDSGGDPHAAGGAEGRALDPRIVMTYQPASAPLIFAAHPGGIHLVYNGTQGRELAREVSVGEIVTLMPGLGVRVDALVTHAVEEVKPFVVPRASRQRNAGERLSMIRLEVTDGGRTQTKWMPFHEYAFPNEQYAAPGRFAYEPTRVQLAGGEWVELLFSRERRRLPHPVAMERFDLLTHTGGYTGGSSTIRNYESRLTFHDAGRWTEPVTISVNAPTEYGGYWFFQSTWDPPMRGRAGSGMNFTGLGVGNRNGVYIQLAGCCIAVAGMLFAFYVKPILKRRRFERSRSRLARGETAENPDRAEHASEPTPVGETA